MKLLGARPGLEVRRLAAFAVLQSLVHTMVFVVDRAMLAQHGEVALSAMQVGGTLEWAVFSLCMAFEVGTLAEVGQHVGRGDLPSARRAAMLSLGFAVAVGALVAVAAALTPEVVGLYAPEASTAVRDASTGYLSWSFRASPAVFAALTLASIFQASGDTRTPMLVALLSNIVHIGLNRLWILGAFGVAAEGATGAGKSLMATFVVESGLLLICLPRLPLWRGLGERLAASWARIARGLWQVATPAVLDRVLFFVGYLTSVRFLTQLGDQAMAGNQALLGLEAVCFLSAEGFGIAASSVVSRRIGAGDLPDAMASARRAAIDSAFVLTSCGLLALLFRAPLLRVFVADDSPAFQQASQACLALALAQPFMGASVVLASALRGAGRTRHVLWVNTVSVLGVRVAATAVFVLVARLGLLGVWLGSLTDWVVRTTLYLLTTRVQLRRAHDVAQARLGVMG